MPSPSLGQNVLFALDRGTKLGQLRPALVQTVHGDMSVDLVFFAKDKDLDLHGLQPLAQAVEGVQYNVQDPPIPGTWRYVDEA